MTLKPGLLVSYCNVGNALDICENGKQALQLDGPGAAN